MLGAGQGPRRSFLQPHHMPHPIFYIPRLTLDIRFVNLMTRRTKSPGQTWRVISTANHDYVVRARRLGNGSPKHVFLALLVERLLSFG